MPKSYKLTLHPKNFSSEDCLINQKESGELQKGSFVEIFSPEEDNCHLLLQVTSFNEEIKGDISVGSQIGIAFSLKNFSTVCVNVINDPATCSLDSVEITFKDQYMGRSEMWRIRNWLTNTCVYINKKLDYCEGSIRCQIYEMWSKGNRVACGVITENTKIVFRSSTSNLYLFIQMSSEMWDFDIHGDLYFEKAINGFLADLFQKWKKLGSNHDVTILLFSRTFYEAKSIEEFPEVMRKCIQIDHRNRFYEDFYRLAIQNDRFDDWNAVLTKLRTMFTNYQHQVLGNYSNLGLPNIPKAYNSTAAQGNYLEVLNMSLNVFERHYLDRTFDRTGQLSVVISPGVGIFEVDRELTNITMQRIIDSGVGSDLVCVGEQPLHAVPLLKFHNKHTCCFSKDDYSMPHWINLSFYQMNKKVAYSTFVPRIKLPPLAPKNSKPPTTRADYQMESTIHNNLFDYDEYDAHIFTFTPPKDSPMSPLGASDRDSSYQSPKISKLRERKLSSPEVHHRIECVDDTIKEDLCVIGKGRINSFTSITNNRTLINPFDPAHVTVKLTSNRRRWTHIFPRGPSGLLVQQHHHNLEPNGEDRDLYDGRSSEGDRLSLSGSITGGKSSSKSTALLWGATGEQAWTPALMTGVDWKSLTIPACLPITTDFFPEESSLQNDYVFSAVYTLLPEDLQLDFAVIRSNQKAPLTASDVFRELVSQRLAQGFQAILMPLKKSSTGEETLRCNTPRLGSNPEEQREQLLSIGRIFHKIMLNGSAITVNQYRPRHPHPMKDVQYRYRFQAPYMNGFEDEEIFFTTEKLENYKWNYLDQYICARGHTDFSLKEDMKYWRYRLLLLPKDDVATKKILEGNLPCCDIYSVEEMIPSKKQCMDDFFKFLENHLNRVKKQQKKTQKTTSVSSPLRERLGSTRLIEKSRPRSGSVKVGEKSKIIYGTMPESHMTNMNVVTLFDHCEDNEDAFSTESIKLKATASTKEIFDLFINPLHGINYLTLAPTLPSCVFTSSDAINWIATHMEGPVDPIRILCRLKDEKYICHASGDSSQPIIVGFYLYYVVQQDFNFEDCKKPLGNLRLFENEWMEVEIVDSLEKVQSIPLMKARTDMRSMPTPQLYKECYIDVDVNNKSDRSEWGHAKYQRVMVPGFAFEIAVEWIAASGSIINDLVNGWNRKALHCNLQLVPVPNDSSAEERKEKLNPFRSPIFVPLIFDGIDDAPRTFTTNEIPLLQSIATRFGFLPTIVTPMRNQLYVHCTGMMFLYLPPFNKTYTTVLNDSEFCSSDHPFGFLWNFNHLIPSRRWRSCIINDSDELLQHRLLRDFKNFASNVNNRLAKFLFEYRSTHIKPPELSL